ncbi:MAG: FAD-dependent oxidoreductase, partial [bacterium]|nr:FAD-dependent oxidoreductase [bacterium]
VVKLDPGGYILTDENMQTSVEGIYAGGDCRQKSLRQVVTACGDGAVSAFSARHYVDKLKGTEYK